MTTVTLAGVVRNGVVEFPAGDAPPDGTAVGVVVAAPQTRSPRVYRDGHGNVIELTPEEREELDFGEQADAAAALRVERTLEEGRTHDAG